MSKSLVPAVVFVGMFVLAGAVYVVLPGLNSPQVVADQEVREHVEQARRLLAQVNENKERLGVVLEGLWALGVEDLPDDELAELVEEDRELLDDAGERLNEIFRSNDMRRGLLAEKMASAGGNTLPPLERRYGGNVGQMVSAIREGIAARDRVLEQNERLLAQALQAADGALAVSHGDASGADDPVALNIKGLVLYAQGCALHRQARPLRDEAHGPRVQLQLALSERARRTAEQGIVKDSDIDARIVDTRELVSKHRAAADSLAEEIRSLEGKIAGMEEQLAGQRQTADEARQTLDRLLEQAAGLRDSYAFERFAAQYGAESVRYRQALRRAQILEFGTLSNAVLEPTGDLLTGRYLPDGGTGEVEPQPGLIHHRSELEQLQARATGVQETIAGLDGQIETMEASKAALASQAELAAGRARELEAMAGESLESLLGLVAEAEELEEQAIGKLEMAARTFKQAQARMQAQQSDASSSISGLSPEAQQNAAASMFSGDRWSKGSLEAREADAQLRLAMVYFDQYRDLRADVQILAEVPEALAEAAEAEIDLEALEGDLELVTEAGSEAAASAADLLMRASRSLEQHFSLAAQVAAAYSLQSLFGQPELSEAAKANYQAAIDGREDSPAVQKYVQRLQQMRRTGQ